MLGSKVLVGLLAAAASLSVGASAAQAGVSLSVSPSVPPQVAVGQSGLLASFTVQNVSQNGAGETGYDTDSYELNDLTLVVSCGQQAFSGDCPAGARDTGVLAPSSTGMGRAGTACSGVTFSISLIDAGQDKYRFASSPFVVVGPSAGSAAAATCTIDFTLSVSRTPSIDANPVVPGLQTAQLAAASARDITTSSPNFNQTGSGVGSSSTTVARAQPSIATTASPGIQLGSGTLNDTATVSGRVNPVAGATITFRLYGPDDTTCTTTPVFSPAPVAYPVAGGPVSSPAFTPTQPGTYRWIASYSGDANNAPVTGACNDASETAVVSAPPAPDAPVITSGPDGTQTSTSARFEFVGAEGATFECRLDTVAYTACTSPTSYAGLAIGTHTFAVRQISAQGKTSPAATRSFTIAAPPPPAQQTTATSTPPTIPTRPRTLSVVVRARSLVLGGRVSIGCRLDRPSLHRCRVTLRIAGRVVGTGSTTLTQKGRRDVTVRVRLTGAALRSVQRAVGGKSARISARVEAFGSDAVLRARQTTRVVSPRLFVVGDAPVFAIGSARLRPGAASFLQALSADLGGVRSIRCTGHTDSVGTFAANERLGLARARAVCAFLARRRPGVSTRSVTRGERAPRATNATERGRALNRRVELVVTR